MKKKRLMITLLLVISILMFVGFAYAYLAAGVNNDKAQTASITTGTMNLTFADNDNGINEQMVIGNTITKKFKIQNTGSLDATASIYWSNLINTYMRDSLTYELTVAPTETGTYEPIDLGNIPASSNETLLSDGIYVPAQTTYYYNLNITFENLKDIDQFDDLDAIMSTKFNIKSTNYNMLRTIITTPSSGTVTFLGGPTARQDYEAVYIVDHINIPANATHSWDVSHLQNGSVMAWNMNEDGDDKYELYIGQEGGVVANVNSKYLFASMTNVINIDLTHLKTQKTRNVMGMFRALSSLTQLDLDKPNFDTSNVTIMDSFLQDNTNLTHLSMDGLNTSKVTSMLQVFANCNSMTILDLSNWDTKNVINMQSLFFGCSSLTSVGIENWDTSNVEKIRNMFSNCSSLETLNLSNWNTSKVKSLAEMFFNCSNLRILNLSNWITTNVTDMNDLFLNCAKLTSLDLSSFDTKNVTNMSRMFCECKSLVMLDLSSFDISSVNVYNDMFLNSEIQNIKVNTNAQNFINTRLTEAGISPMFTVVSK